MNQLTPIPASELAQLRASHKELVEALQLLDQAENGPWDGDEQRKYLSHARAKANAALANAEKVSE